jgi:hypothetical protein
MSKVYEIHEEQVAVSARISGLYHSTNLENIVLIFEQIFQRRFMLLVTEQDLKAEIQSLIFKESDLSRALNGLLQDKLSHLEWLESAQTVVIYDPRHVRKNSVMRRRTDMLFIYESFCYDDAPLVMSFCSALLFICEHFSRSIIVPVEYFSLETTVEITPNPREPFGNFLEKVLRKINGIEFECFENVLRFRKRRIPVRQIN